MKSSTTCWNCKYASIHTYSRRGVGASSHVGLFHQDGAYCGHPDAAGAVKEIFWGKTHPRYCPLKRQTNRKKHVAYARSMAFNPNQIR